VRGACTIGCASQEDELYVWISCKLLFSYAIKPQAHTSTFTNINTHVHTLTLPCPVVTCIQDEMRGGMTYVNSVIFDIVPVFHRRIDTALANLGQPRLPLTHTLFKFGSWMGGDRCVHLHIAIPD
jgi:phosphoenolpyruvate carboxylase